MSALRFGAAFVYGMPSLIAAYAYTMLDGIVSSFASSAASNASIVACAGASVRYTSVLPHHTMTSRSRPFSALNLPDVRDHLVREVLLVPAGLHVRARQTLHVPLVEDRGPRRDRLELGLDLVEQRGLEHAGRARRLVAVLAEDVPPAEHDVVEGCEGKHVGDPRRPSVGAFAESDRAHLGERSDGLREALADGVHPGDEGRADGAESDEKDAEFALCWRNLDGFHRGVELYHSAMALFRHAPPQQPLIVSITGVRIGQRIVGVIGGDARLFLDVAARVGITGGATR